MVTLLIAGVGHGTASAAVPRIASMPATKREERRHLIRFISTLRLWNSNFRLERRSVNFRVLNSLLTPIHLELKELTGLLRSGIMSAPYLFVSQRCPARRAIRSAIA